MKDAGELAIGFNIIDVFPSLKYLYLISGLGTKFERMHEEVDKILENIINEHKEKKATTKADGEDAGAEDLIDVFLKFHLEHGGDKDFSLTTDNIKAVIVVSILTFC